METCVRGFSFMTESKADLQYIEGGELERTWRSTRRERTKQREQRIWDNFVKEQDIVKGVCKDDPYQFLDPLPESCLKDVLEQREHPKTTPGNAEADAKTKVREEPTQHASNDKSPTKEVEHTCVVTFADDLDKDDCDMFHIFDDEQSGDDEFLNESGTPDTVRERPADETGSPDHSPDRNIDLNKSSSKSSENVASVIESSIYCARVKELRQKINEELLSLMETLNRRDILMSSEPAEIGRMIKRSAEFCNRFNRIYMYQLQRQIHDIKRNNSQSLPFAKHTQFQSQMTRIVTLHQNLLGSFQVFHKSFTQTCCVRESAGALGSLLAAVRDSTHMCLNVPPPKDFAACLDLYKDDLISTCDKVDEFINEYAIRCEEFLNRFEMHSGTSKKVKKETKVKKRSWNKSNISNRTESQLSMYSMDHNMRLSYNSAKPTSAKDKDNQLGTSLKLRLATGTATNLKKGPADKTVEPPKSTRRSRRPLMRDPHAGRPRAPKPTRETDIRTMVEAVETCASAHLINEDSPHGGARLSKRSTPHRVPLSPSAAHPPHASPHVTPNATPHTTPHATPRPMPHATPVQVSPQITPRQYNMHENAQKKFVPPPSHPKPRKMHSPARPKLRQRSPKRADSPSLTKLEQEGEELMPVLTIKCAIKKDLQAPEPKPREGRDWMLSAGSRNSSPRKKLPRVRQDNSKERKASTDPSQLKMVYNNRGECSKAEGSPRHHHSPARNREAGGEKTRTSSVSPDRCEVSRLLKQLCSGDTSGRTERVTGNKNVQLVYVSGSSPRQPSTPQLLRKPEPIRAPDRYRLLFNISEKTADSLFQYRTKFVQHMLTSSMYANSAVGKPWEMIGNVSEQIINDILLSCLKDMELRDVIQEMYKKETY